MKAWMRLFCRSASALSLRHPEDRGQTPDDRARTTEDGRRMTSVFRYLSSVVRSPLSGALLGGSESRVRLLAELISASARRPGRDDPAAVAGGFPQCRAAHGGIETRPAQPIARAPT